MMIVGNSLSREELKSRLDQLLIEETGLHAETRSPLEALSLLKQVPERIAKIDIERPIVDRESTEIEAQPDDDLFRIPGLSAKVESARREVITRIRDATTIACPRLDPLKMARILHGDIVAILDRYNEIDTSQFDQRINMQNVSLYRSIMMRLEQIWDNPPRIHKSGFKKFGEGLGCWLMNQSDRIANKYGDVEGIKRNNQSWDLAKRKRRLAIGNSCHDILQELGRIIMFNIQGEELDMILSEIQSEMEQMTGRAINLVDGRNMGEFLSYIQMLEKIAEFQEEISQVLFDIREIAFTDTTVTSHEEVAY